MKEIGNKLQQKRKDLKLTIAKVAKTTKMPEAHLCAIEEGDFDYFKNDITYLRFYVRAYCKALGVPFEEVKDEYNRSIEEYTQTMSLKAIQEHEELESQIHSRSIEAEKLGEAPIEAKKDRSSIRQNVKQGGKFRKKGKLDMSLLSLLAIVLVVIVVLIFVLFSNTFLNNDNDTSNAAPKVEETTPTPEKEKEKEKPKEPETAKITQTEINPNQYEIRGVKVDTDLKIEISFESRSWLQGTLNGAALDLGTGIFEGGTSATYEGKATAENTFVFSFGAYRDTTIIKVNGQKVEVNPSLATSGGTPTITISVIGE